MKLFSPPRIVRKAGISVVDQAMLSAFNFFLGVLLIKRVEQHEYGLYVLATSFVLLVVGVQNALVTTQLTVIAPKKPRSEQREFAAALAFGQFIYWLPAAITAGGLLLLLGHFAAIPADLNRVLFIGVFTALGTLVREFARGYYFHRMNPAAVFRVDSTYLAVALLMIGAAVFLPLPYLHIWALAIVGFSAVAAATFDVFRIGRAAPLSNKRIFSAIRECWVNGKWALLGVFVTWLQTQCYVFLIVTLLGADEMAVTHSARLMLMPVALLNMSFSMIFRAKWAHDWHGERPKKVFSSAIALFLAVASTIVVYSSLLLVFQEHIIGLVFRREYLQAGSYIHLWALIFAIQAARNIASLLLQVFEKFKFLTLVNAVTAIVTIVLGLLLIPSLGAKGSLISMAVGELFLAAVLLVQVNGYRRAGNRLETGS